MFISNEQLQSSKKKKHLAYKLSFGAFFPLRHPPHLLLIKPEPNSEGYPACKGRRNGINETLHRLKDKKKKKIKWLQTKLVQMSVAHHFSGLERCLFGEKIELALRITHLCPSPHYIRSKTTNNSSSCI